MQGPLSGTKRWRGLKALTDFSLDLPFPIDYHNAWVNVFFCSAAVPSLLSGPSCRLSFPALPHELQATENASLESMAYEMPISQLLCFDIHTKCRGVGVLWRSLATMNAFEPCLSRILAVRPVLERNARRKCAETPSTRFCSIL